MFELHLTSRGIPGKEKEHHKQRRGSNIMDRVTMDIEL